MMQDDLDHILGSEPRVAPSDRFSADVMRAIRAEALAPPPIPFPWRRLAIGTVAAGILVAAVTFLPEYGGAGLGAQIAASAQQIKTTLNNSGAFWLAAGALVSYLSVKLSLLSTA